MKTAANSNPIDVLLAIAEHPNLHSSPNHDLVRVEAAEAILASTDPACARDEQAASAAVEHVARAEAALVEIMRSPQCMLRDRGRAAAALLKRGWVAALVLLCACSSFQRRTGLMFAADAVTLCDTASTIELSDGGAWDYESRPDHALLESNPVLGRRSAPKYLALVWTGVVIGNAVAAARAPSWLAYALFGAEIAVETYASASNAKWAGPCGVGGPRLERTSK